MIIITEEAKEFLKKKKKKSVTIEYPAYRTNCCAYSVPMPEIFIKEPKDQVKNAYDHFSLDGFDVYIGKAVIAPKGGCIEIGLESILGFKQLTLRGWSINEVLEA